MREENLTPFIEKYEKTLRSNPSSLVFAPLAECYRKLGMKEQAIQLLREGIKKHPNYILGYISLSQLAYEQGNFELVYSTLRPHLETHRDNLKFMKLFSDSCYELEKFEEALNGYKYILFLNPKDQEVAAIISRLENSPAVDEGPKAESKSSGQFFDIDNLKTSPGQSEDEEQWVQKDFSAPKRSVNDSLENWTVDTLVNSEELRESIAVEEDGAEFTISCESETDSEGEKERVYEVDTSVNSAEKKGDQPIITHTLVDLYLSQGYLDKAYGLLEKILDLNPSDEQTAQKLQEIKSLLHDSDFEESPKVQDEVYANEPDGDDTADDLDEEGQRAQLMSLFDKKIQQNDAVKKTETDRVELESVLWDFHQKLKERAKRQRHDQQFTLKS